MKKLNKSAFLQYLENPVLSWYLWHEAQLLENREQDLADAYRRQEGYHIEDYAKALIYKQTPEKEHHYVDFQAVAQNENLYARADILIYRPAYQAYDLYEIKSSTSVKEQHIRDLCFQKQVFEETDRPIHKLFVIYVNKNYIRQGTIDSEGLLVVSDVSEAVNRIEATVQKAIKGALNYLEQARPAIKLSSQWKKDLQSPLIKAYLPDLPVHSVFDISHISDAKLDALLESQIVDIRNVPDDFPLSHKQRQQVRLAQKDKHFIDIQAIGLVLDQLKYPLYFLDYETFNPAIPFYDAYAPYQQIVFQYSLHRLDKQGGELHHSAFICQEPEEPSSLLLKQLSADLPTKGGQVIVWNQSFECSMNKEMGKLHPEYTAYLAAVNDRIFDLRDIFTAGYYQAADFRGSTSIKRVLPVLVPELSYKKLAIADGQTASIEWARAQKMFSANSERAKIYNNLLEYCHLDTLAMVRILENLQALL